MDNLSNEPMLPDLIKGVNLRCLLSTYIFLKPGTTQNDIAKRFNVGQMTVSRMLTKEYPIKEEWVPIVADILYELSKLDITEYRMKVASLAGTCETVSRIAHRRKVSSILYNQLLQNESKDFIELEQSLRGFSYFSWDKKISWAFIDVEDFKFNKSARALEHAQPPEKVIEKYFPKRRDKVTFYASKASDYNFIVNWYSRINWENPEIDYTKQQQHSIVLVDLENDTIVESKVLR